MKKLRLSLALMSFFIVPAYAEEQKSSAAEKEELLLEQPEMSVAEQPEHEGVLGAYLRSLFARVRNALGVEPKRGAVEYVGDKLDRWARFSIAGAASIAAYRAVPPESALALMFHVLDHEPLSDALHHVHQFEKQNPKEKVLLIKQLVRTVFSASVFAGTRIGLWFFI